MRKKLLLILTVLSLMLTTISLQGFTSAQTVPDYVGVSEGDYYEWEMELNNDTLDKMMDGIKSIKDDLKNELGDLGELNTSEFIQEIILNFTSFALPSNWDELNATELFEASLNEFIIYVNTTYDLDISPIWKTMNITDFADEFIDGFDATGYTLYDLFDRIVNETETSEFGRFLPLDWEELTFKEFMGWQIDNTMNAFLKNITGDTFEIPVSWQNLNFSSFMAGMIPGLDTNFVDFILYMTNLSIGDDPMTTSPIPMLLEYDMTDLIDFAILGFNSTLPPNTTLDLTTSTMSEILNYTMMLANNESEIIPENWDELTISTLFEEVITNINETGDTPIDLLNSNMSDFIEFWKDMINESLYQADPSLPSKTAGELFNEMTFGIISSINMSLYNIIPNWNELTINQLIDEFYSLMEAEYQFGLNELNAESGLLSPGIKIKLNITDIASEELVAPGINGVKITYGLQCDPGIGEYQNIDDLNITIPLPESIYILNPDDFSDFMDGFARQTNLSMMLFIGKTFQKSKITFRNMTVELPDPFPDINLNLDWDDKGTLDHATLKYGSDTVFSIQKPTVDGDGGGQIPGYGTIILLGFSVFSILGLIYVLRNKNLVSYSN